eukprot:6187596-Pleurochrysis_carterae.AAC.1
MTAQAAENLVCRWLTEAKGVPTGGWRVGRNTPEATRCLAPTSRSLQSAEKHAGARQLQTCATTRCAMPWRKGLCLLGRGAARNITPESNESSLTRQEPPRRHAPPCWLPDPIRLYRIL